MKPSGGDTTNGTCKYTYSSILDLKRERDLLYRSKKGLRGAASEILNANNQTLPYH